MKQSITMMLKLASSINDGYPFALIKYLSENLIKIKNTMNSQITKI